MMESPPNSMEIEESNDNKIEDSTEIHSVTTRKRTIEKVSKMSEYEGLTGVEVKMEQMDMAEREAQLQETTSPPKKTKSNQQVIVIDDKEMVEEDQGSNKKKRRNRRK